MHTPSAVDGEGAVDGVDLHVDVLVGERQTVGVHRGAAGPWPSTAR